MLKKMSILKWFIVLSLVMGVFFLNSCKTDDFGLKRALYPSKIFINNFLQTEYQYNDQMRVEKVVYYDTLGNAIQQQQYEFEKGLPVKITRYGLGDQPNQITVNEYNDQLLLIKSTDYQADEKTEIRSSVYAYDQKNQCVRVETYFNNKQAGYNAVNQFDNENLSQTQIYVHDSLAATINYTYDDKLNYLSHSSTAIIKYSKNNPTSSSSASMNSSGFVVVQITPSFSILWTPRSSVYAYNEDGYPVKETRTYFREKNPVELFEYEYIEKVR